MKTSFLQLVIFPCQQDAIAAVKIKVELTIIWWSAKEEISACKKRKNLAQGIPPYHIILIIKNSMIWCYVKFTGSFITLSPLSQKISSSYVALSALMNIKATRIPFSARTKHGIPSLINARTIHFSARECIKQHNLMDLRFVF